ncbi:LOW QUALITY PROTEIN: E3 ubiquitin-protein ligase ZSWIM2 [Cottoperca gobio]|uniref:LOW QUALITY PROTEIN: E3 ubiquitin-protein ligase ZSWIM2 n=1 Tax=Cottoperca gobio TaxID=56716 RepID=A0A6J2R8C0_COTGO|nr:LOW QUALITY PROTEIN: E3 ubiquitin-protein ligase ZSWIM2 [Cottoperca gobio]
MFRRSAWRHTVSDAVRFHQEQALNTTMFVLKTFGPTRFLLGEGETTTFRVCLGDPHACSCSVFIKEQVPCKHICWVLMRRFKLPIAHEYSFQHGLLEGQISKLLDGLHQHKDHRTRNGPTESVCQKVIQAQDVCPICQEDLLEGKRPVSYCRFGCGKSVHITCIKAWAEHKGFKETVKCPLCREDFSSLTLLQEQVKNAAKLFSVAERETSQRHLGVSCHRCRVSPVTGRCFKCTVCSYFYLCEKCSKKGCHPQHPFASRTNRMKKWHLVVEDLRDETRGASSQPQNDSIIPEAADPVPEHVLRGLPTVRVKSGARLLDVGQQCRICLLDFILGQHVRTLPCQHKFHADCVDGLLRKSNCCPLDGYVIYNPLTRKNEHSLGNTQQQRQTET